MRVLAPLAPMEAESVWRGLTGGAVVVALAGVNEDDKPMVAVATNEAARKAGITKPSPATTTTKLKSA